MGLVSDWGDRLMFSFGERNLDSGHHVGIDDQRRLSAPLGLPLRRHFCTHADLRVSRLDRRRTSESDWHPLKLRPAMDRSIIEHYESGGEKLSLAIRGLSRDDLTTKPAADAPKEVGRWS